MGPQEQSLPACTKQRRKCLFGRPVKKLADKKVNAIRLRGRKLIAATDCEGILMKSGSVLKTLVEPVADTNVNILSLISF